MRDDFYAGDGKHADLYLEQSAQPVALLSAGFIDIQLLHDDGGMALYAGGRG